MIFEKEIEKLADEWCEYVFGEDVKIDEDKKEEFLEFAAALQGLLLKDAPDVDIEAFRKWRNEIWDQEGEYPSPVRQIKWQHQQSSLQIKLARMALHTNKVQAGVIGELEAEVERLKSELSHAKGFAAKVGKGNVVYGK